MLLVNIIPMVILRFMKRLSVWRSLSRCAICWSMARVTLVLLTVIAFLGLSMPNFWLGIVLILFFSVHLGWFPSMGYASLDNGVWPWLRHLLLPAFTTGIAFAAIITRMTRSTMLEVLNELYVSTARSKGLPERVVVLKHALRNALIPVITVIGIAFSDRKSTRLNSSHSSVSRMPSSA